LLDVADNRSSNFSRATKTFCYTYSLYKSLIYKPLDEVFKDVNKNLPYMNLSQTCFVLEEIANLFLDYWVKPLLLDPLRF
jgi:hypothetical protein